jgi:hypothetical protein
LGIRVEFEVSPLPSPLEMPLWARVSQKRLAKS